MKSAEFGMFPCHITLINAWVFFGEKNSVVNRKPFFSLWETVFREPCKESVSKQKNHFVAFKSNLINLWFNLPPWSLQEYLKRLYATNL